MNRSELAALYGRVRREGWALGQFNVENMEYVQAVAGACREEKSPAIFAASGKTIDYFGIDLFTSIIRSATAGLDIPVITHLDHGGDFATAKACVDAGFTSVMIDGSALPLEENIRVTKDVVEYAHAKNVFVEGELGHIGGKEDDAESEDILVTDPDDAERFVRETGVDSLAIAVGTSHGAYKFRGEPRLDFDKITEIGGRVDVPLVLHGASGVDAYTVERINRYGGRVEGASGVPAEAYREAIKRGIAKVNIATDLRLAFIASLRKSFWTQPDLIDPRKYLGSARTAVEDLVREKMRLLGSSGRF